MNIIVCTNKEGGIGYEGGIPWKNPEDMAFFKETTLGKTVVMGHKTWQSIKKPLNGRKNIVLSKMFDNERYVCKGTKLWLYDSLEKVIEDCEEELFLIGGAQLYEYALANGYVDKIYYSYMQIESAADTYFPVKYLDFFSVQSETWLNSYTRLLVYER